MRYALVDDVVFSCDIRPRLVGGMLEDDLVLHEGAQLSKEVLLEVHNVPERIRGEHRGQKRSPIRAIKWRGRGEFEVFYVLVAHKAAALQEKHVHHKVGGGAHHDHTSQAAQAARLYGRRPGAP